MPTNSTPKGYRYRVMSDTLSTIKISDGGLVQLMPGNITLSRKVEKCESSLRLYPLYKYLSEFETGSLLSCSISYIFAIVIILMGMFNLNDALYYHDVQVQDEIGHHEVHASDSVTYYLK